MNPLDQKLVTGTTGELLVQLRFFQYGVQAAPPLKDSGNDLIAVREHVLKAVQVKTTAETDHDNELLLDKSEVYLVDRELIDAGGFNLNDLEDHRISQAVVDRLFPRCLCV
jgi:hypothetical protein